MSQQHDLHSKLLIAFTINEPKTQFLRVLSISKICEKCAYVNFLVRFLLFSNYSFIHFYFFLSIHLKNYYDKINDKSTN